ncbi:MAG: hypothetical protein ABIW79_04755 [Gemmatimonas sp.]
MISPDGSVLALGIDAGIFYASSKAKRRSRNPWHRGVSALSDYL